MYLIIWPDVYFDLKNVLMLKEKKPNLFLANSEMKRNQGHIMNTGQKLGQEQRKLFRRHMLLSKRPEMFLQIFGRFILKKRRM